ncbi:MAG: hypothetical protein ACFB6R_03735 [Alphaproteobacteria bacterium]
MAGGLPGIGIDDANITQVYARNIADGMGVVYWRGGERVEGSTSFLWTLINALVFALPADPEPVLLLLSFVFTSLTVFLTLRLGQVFANLAGSAAGAPVLPGAVTGVTGAVMAVQWPFFGWSVFSLMDLALWCVLFVSLILGLCHLVGQTGPLPRRLGWGVPLAAGALALTRPEGFAAAGGLCALALLLTWRSRTHGTRVRTAGHAIGAVVLATAVLTLWRLWYFGSPVPNTAYAKVSQDGLKRIGLGLDHVINDFLLASPGHLVLLGLWIFIMVRIVRRRPGVHAPEQHREHRMGPALLICGAGIGGILETYTVAGGDHFPLFRFFQPIVPLLSLAPALLLLQVPRLQRSWLAAMALIPIALACLFTYVDQAEAFRREFLLARNGRSLGAHLNTLVPKPSIAVVAAGGIARTFEGEIYDLMGLNWTAMAKADPDKTGDIINHAGFDAPTFWTAEPDLLVVTPFADKQCPAPPEAIPCFSMKALKFMPCDDRFKATYTLALVDCRPVFVHARYRDALFSQERVTVIAARQDWCPGLDRARRVCKAR